MYSTVILLLYSLLHSTSPRLNLKLEVCTFWPSSPISPTSYPCLWRPPACSLYLWVGVLLFLLFKSHRWERSYDICLSQSDLFYLVSELRVHSWCHKWQDFFFFRWLNNIPFYIHLSVRGHSGCFHILTVVNNAAVNMVGVGGRYLFQLVFLFPSDKFPVKWNYWITR